MPHLAAPNRRAALLSTSLAVLGLLLLGPAAVSPAGMASASETDPPPAPAPVSTVVIAAPVIEQPVATELVGDTISFSGTAEPGSGVDLFSSTGGQPLCSVVTSGSATWSCEVTLDSTPSETVRAVQSVEGQTTETSVQIAVLNAPTAGPGGGGTVSSGTVTGTAVPSAAVTATVAGVSCSSTADPSGAWFCTLPRGVPSGSYQLTASQVAPWSGGRSSASSPPTTLTIDADAPSPPTVTIPASPVATSGATFSGAGEDGARVTVFAGPHSLCQAVVAGGHWACTSAPLEAGSYAVSAIQQDVAGNISEESARVSVTFGAAQTPAPGPTATHGSAPAAPHPRPSAASPVLPGGEPAAATAQQPHDDQGVTAEAPTAEGGWSASTRFSAGMQPAFGTPGSIDWTAAFAIGLAMVALLAVPARLLAGTLRGLRGESLGREAAGGRFTARNRSRHEEYDTAPELTWSTRVTGAFALVAAATITVLSAPVADEPAYLRLLVAVVLGILAVNAVAILVPRLVARVVFGISVGIRLRPILLLVSVGATVLSRTLDLDPTLVFGLVFALTVSTPASRRAEGRLAALQVGSLLVVGVTALLLSGALWGGTDAAGAFVAEFVNTVALGALGSSALLLVPIADLPGRRILRWRPLVWVALAVTGFTLVGGVLSSALGGLGGGAGLILIALASLSFAAICVAVWVWARFVRAPGHRDSSTPSA